MEARICIKMFETKQHMYDDDRDDDEDDAVVVVDDDDADDDEDFIDDDDDDGDDDDDEDEDEEGEDEDENEDDDPLPAGNLGGGSGGTRGDRTWACGGGSNWKVSGFPIVLLPAYSLLKQEQLQLAQLSWYI